MVGETPERGPIGLEMEAELIETITQRRSPFPIQVIFRLGAHSEVVD